MSGRTKIHFRLSQDDDAHSPGDEEWVWAIQVGSRFVIDSIPFCTREATVGDLISVLSDHVGKLWFDDIETPSAHSLIRVVFFDAASVEPVHTFLEALGCTTERMEEFRLLAVDVPPEADMPRIQAFLRDETGRGRLDFEEAILRQ